jgi:tetratricopeptide (TPR) repeat protein
MEGEPARQGERTQTQNVEAYQLYLKGMAFFYKRGIHMFEGIRYFQDALKIDPDYALALTGMADSYTMLCLHSYIPPEEAWPKAKAAVNHALQLAPDLAAAHSAIATISLLFERNWDKAEKEYLKALELNPHYLQAQCWYALFYCQGVKWDHMSALRHTRIAIENDPLSAYAQTILSLVACNAGMIEEGIAAGEKAVEFDPESFSAWYYKGYSNHCAGNIEAAIKAYTHAIEISGRHTWAVTTLLVLYSESSEFQDIQKAEFLYRELLIREKTGYVNPFSLAMASAALGKPQQAVQYIKQAMDRHDPWFGFSDRPDNKALREIPEFKKTKELIGLGSF